MTTINLFRMVLLAILAFQDSPSSRSGGNGYHNIAGRVSSATTHESLGGVQVTAIRVASPGASERTDQSVITDADGKFLLNQIAAGQYRLLFSRNGFVKQVYGQKMSSQGTILNVAADDINDLEMELTPTSTVIGRILNPDGKPLKNVLAQLIRNRYNTVGQGTEDIVASAETDDDGTYRLSLISPGIYYLAVSEMRSTSLPRPAAERSKSIPTTYYPGTRTIREAVPLDLRAGAEHATGDFTVPRTAEFSVKGHITGNGPRQPLDRFVISVLSYNRGNYITFGTLYDYVGAYEPSTGEFRVKNLPQGTYLVSAARSGAGITPRGSTLVTVSDKDIDNLVINISPHFEILGRVYLKGAGDAKQTVKEVEGLQVRLLTVVNGRIASVLLLQSPTARSVTGGQFAFKEVVPFEYQVAIEGLPPGYYVSSIHFEGSDGLGRALSISGPGMLNVEINRAAASIGGNASDVLDHPVPYCQIVLVPERGIDRPDLYRSATADVNGHYKLSNIAPGQYSLLAFESIEANSWFDSEVISRFKERSKLVIIGESESIGMDVKAIPFKQ